MACKLPEATICDGVCGECSALEKSQAREGGASVVQRAATSRDRRAMSGLGGLIPLDTIAALPRRAGRRFPLG